MKVYLDHSAHQALGLSSSFFHILCVSRMFKMTFCGGLLLHQCITCSKPKFVVVLKCLIPCIIAGHGQINWKGTLWFYLLWKDLIIWCYVPVSYSVALISASRHYVNLSVVFCCFVNISQEYRIILNHYGADILQVKVKTQILEGFTTPPVVPRLQVDWFIRPHVCCKWLNCSSFLVSSQNSASYDVVRSVPQLSIFFNVFPF